MRIYKAALKYNLLQFVYIE